jgi:hypothetical protein
MPSTSARVNGSLGECRACGSLRIVSYLCCLVDPLRDGKSIYAAIKEDCWCRWCGADVPKGRAFCSPACGHSYAEDVGVVFR